MCRVGAVGGDGMVDGVFVSAHRSGDLGDCSFGILRLGTANDFALSVGLRVDDMTACLRLIVNDPATRTDLGLLGERPFVNVVTGGFGARVTAETDPALNRSEERRVGEEGVRKGSRWWGQYL